MSYEDALKFTLSWEGGYSDNPSDRGGATSKGITQRVYDAYRADSGLPLQPVKFITDDDVSAIYRGRYWDAIRGSQLPGVLGLVCFDAAVNSGPHRAAVWLQQALGVTDDGDIGPKTLAAAASCNPVETTMTLLQIREDFLRAIVERDSSQMTFLHGWLNRVNALRKLVQS